MKQKLLIILFFVIINMVGFSQKVEWKQNGLTWHDFKGNPDLNAKFQSELNYYIGYNTEKLTQNDTIIYRYKASCYIETGSSWVNPNSKNNRLLKYNQVLFDLVELYKRKFQDAINHTDNPNEIDDQFKIYSQQLKIIINIYVTQADYGNDKKIVNLWSETINKELELTSDKVIPL